MVHLQYRAPVEHRGAHEHHAVTRDSSWRRVVDIMWLENHFAVGSHGYTISIRQGESFVVVQH